MIRASAEEAPTRLAEIERFVNNEALFPRDLKEFGLKLDRKPLEAEGPVLPTPEMIGGDDQEIKVRDGGWRSGKFFKATQLKLWATILIEDREARNQVRGSDFTNFTQKFKHAGSRLGTENICFSKFNIFFFDHSNGGKNVKFRNHFFSEIFEYFRLFFRKKSKIF